MRPPRVDLPNIRRLFIPDPGYVICDADLSGADAQVVAWEADDEDLKDAFRKGLKLHVKNATDMWGDKYTNASSVDQAKMYRGVKVGVHLTNYGGSARTLAITQGWTIVEGKRFQKDWFALHPGILTWHDRVSESLASPSRSVSNKFGFHFPFFDRISNCFTEALAVVPQSTVATSCFLGALQVGEALSWVQLLLQVHDSLVFQIPKSRVPDLPLVRKHLLNEVPYDDPLIIPWDLAISDRSWGDCKKIEWENARV